MRLFHLLLVLVSTLLLLGCPAPDDNDDDDTASDDDAGDDDDTLGDDDTSAWQPPDGGVIQLETRDGVMLEADYYPSQSEGATAFVLLHMYAVYYDRTGWPLDFIETLTGHGWTVLVPDRRGAGNSEGDPEESWNGEKGKWDVEACVLRLQEDGYGALAVVGASNGTTSMVDYANWAEDEGLPEPVLLGYMTGDAYTIANSWVSNLSPVPAIFTYSTEESAWSVSQMDLDPGTWAFHEYPDGAHGTQMFTAAPEVADDLEAYFLQWLEGKGDVRN